MTLPKNIEFTIVPLNTNSYDSSALSPNIIIEIPRFGDRWPYQQVKFSNLI